MAYLAICLGLFPAVPVLFIAELAIPGQGAAHTFPVNTVFFLSWLGFAIAGLFMKTEANQTRLYVGLGGLLAVLVPITNGIQTGDWLWQSLNKGHQYVRGTDLFWLGASVAALAVFGLLQRNRKVASSGKTVRAATSVMPG